MCFMIQPVTVFSKFKAFISELNEIINLVKLI